MVSLGAIDPAVVCQAYFILTAICVLVVAVLPSAARSLLLDYGPRHSTSKAPSSSDENDTQPSPVSKIAQQLTSLGQIPHSWFITFYYAYLVCSAFWANEYIWDGAVLRNVASLAASRQHSSMTVGQVYLASALQALQALRRLYEHLAIIKPSKSQMWCIHWLLGLSFYLCMSVSVWIEGSSAILRRQHAPAWNEEAIGKALAGVPLFLLAWAMQFQCHRHLAGLKKYSLPEGGMFRLIICPHYTCECILYLSLAVIAAPEGELCNQTLLYAHMFVLINLGVTANGTKAWYVREFGAAKVTGRWKMIPHVF